MRAETIARNYAETLLELAHRSGDLRGWGAMIEDVGDAMQRDRRLWLFLETPRIASEAKIEVVTRACEGQFPPLFIRFLQALFRHRRQMLIPQIAREFSALVDEVEGRIHASVTLARPVDATGRAAIAAQLSKSLGKSVVPHVIVNPAILGGVTVRVGDTVLDGSVRRRLGTLRARMLGR